MTTYTNAFLHFSHTQSSQDNCGLYDTGAQLSLRQSSFKFAATEFEVDSISISDERNAVTDKF